MVRTCTVSYRRAVCAQPHTSSRVEGREVFYFANVYNRLSRKRRYICRSSVYLSDHLITPVTSVVFPPGALLVGFGLRGRDSSAMPLTGAAVQAILTGETTGAEGQLGQFSDNVLRDCKVVSCEPQRLVVTLPVTARITNSSANLHGGASCTLVDTLSALRQPRRYPPCPPRSCLCVRVVDSHGCVADQRLQDVRDH